MATGLSSAYCALYKKENLMNVVNVYTNKRREEQRKAKAEYRSEVFYFTALIAIGYAIYVLVASI